MSPVLWLCCIFACILYLLQSQFFCAGICKGQAQITATGRNDMTTVHTDLSKLELRKTCKQTTGMMAVRWSKSPRIHHLVGTFALQSQKRFRWDGDFGDALQPPAIFVLFMLSILLNQGWHAHTHTLGNSLARVASCMLQLMLHRRTGASESCEQVRWVDQTQYQPWHSPLRWATSYAHGVAPLLFSAEK